MSRVLVGVVDGDAPSAAPACTECRSGDYGQFGPGKPGRIISPGAQHALNSFLSSTSRSMCTHQPGVWEPTRSAACRRAARIMMQFGCRAELDPPGDRQYAYLAAVGAVALSQHGHRLEVQGWKAAVQQARYLRAGDTQQEDNLHVGRLAGCGQLHRVASSCPSMNTSPAWPWTSLRAGTIERTIVPSRLIPAIGHKGISGSRSVLRFGANRILSVMA
jgi:hypothetical protein